MDVTSVVCVAVAFAGLCFCVWLECRYVSRQKQKEADERARFLQALWKISDALFEIVDDLDKMVPYDPYPSEDASF